MADINSPIASSLPTDKIIIAGDRSALKDGHEATEKGENPTSEYIGGWRLHPTSVAFAFPFFSLSSGILLMPKSKPLPMFISHEFGNSDRHYFYSGYYQ